MHDRKNDEVVDDYNHDIPYCDQCDHPMAAHEEQRGHMHCYRCGLDCTITEESAGAWQTQTKQSQTQKRR